MAQYYIMVIKMRAMQKNTTSQCNSFKVVRHNIHFVNLAAVTGRTYCFKISVKVLKHFLTMLTLTLTPDISAKVDNY